MGRPISRTVGAGILLIGGALAVGGAPARAQEPGLGGLLGGYGATSGASMGGTSASGGNALVPFAGKFGTVMPTEMGAGGLAYRPRSTGAMSRAPRSSFTLGSMGMTRMAGGMGRRRPFTLQGGAVSGGMGLGGGMRRMPAAGGMGVMPPSIGYPFRQPPSLLVPSAPGAGTSM